MGKVWSKTDLKNAERGSWRGGLFEPNPSLKRLVVALSEAFGAGAEQVSSLLFVSDEIVMERLDLLEDVLLALLHAPRQGIEPFAWMYIAGLLPTRQRVLDGLHPLVTEDQLEVLATKRFVRSERSAEERQRMKRLLYRVGITGEEGDACVRAIAPPRPPKEHRAKSPQSQTCLEKFVQALYQPEVALRRPHKSKVLRQLGSYGLKETDYRNLVQRKFQPNCLSDSPVNRRQIKEMSRLLGVDPQPFLYALIDK